MGWPASGAGKHTWAEGQRGWCLCLLLPEPGFFMQNGAVSHRGAEAGVGEQPWAMVTFTVALGSGKAQGRGCEGGVGVWA
jgi:hypothetical protein